MLVIPGGPALTPFRLQKLLAQLQANDSGITAVKTEYVHFVDLGKELHDMQSDQLRQLLIGDLKPEKLDGTVSLVVPRIGTISPWSSKATDIIHNSGLSDVNRVERGIAYYFEGSAVPDTLATSGLLHDRMTESVLTSLDAAEALFSEAEPSPLSEVDALNGGKAGLEKANVELGLALAPDEIEYLYQAYAELGRNPTDVELMMFGVVNSEHCRHKVFNADWVVDGKPAEKSLFKMIRNTYEKNHDGILSAYSDNAAVLEGPTAERFFADPNSNSYGYQKEPVHLVIKAETHNHPTAIAPVPGAATGSGGEIRDEGATGRGAKPKVGLAGFSVSNLHVPDLPQPWEIPAAKPNRIASPLDIMLEAPIGAAAYGNEYGRPNLTGYFRTYEQPIPGIDTNTVWGYHKPLMIAGGLGNIRDVHVKKGKLSSGDKIIVIGGPAMLIGLGGGTAASMNSGTSQEDLDFASVQRANAEMEHRAQEVIDHCWALGDKNPIVSIHDVGAGGLSNALPEIVHDSGVGAHFELRQIPNAEPGLTPMQIWSCEAQERYVVGIAMKDLNQFEQICKRERCPYAIVGEATADERLLVTDTKLKKTPVDLPLSVLFGKPPKMTRKVDRKNVKAPYFDSEDIDINDAVERVLQLPAVASKKFLITIGDRTVGGLVMRDQMVGKWQVPVSDVAVTASGFTSETGEAMAMGERTPIALIDAPASARMAVGEAITNITAANIGKLSDVKLSANWMAAVGYGNEDQHLYDAVRAVGEDFCPALGITIPVGKDSLSMRTVWDDKSVTSPLSLIISAFSPVQDVSKTLTPELQAVDSKLLLIDLGHGKNRLGGSALAQVYNQLGDTPPDADADDLKHFFKAVQQLNQEGKLLAYHDRSDGGLLTTLCEMMFASRKGVAIDLQVLPGDDTDQLFSEELGAVIQVPAKDVRTVLQTLRKTLDDVHEIGTITDSQTLVIRNAEREIYRKSRSQLERWWARTSYEIQKLRDNPTSAQQEYDAISDDDNPGLRAVISNDIPAKAGIQSEKGVAEGDTSLTGSRVKPGMTNRPKVAILREQGVNGQIEMAAAFDAAGFTSVDVHMQDLLDGKANLEDFAGLAACGGFSYGDVLGAGEGWAKTILFHPELRKQFKQFFERPDTFSLGVCNGCQVLAALKDLIPGAEAWPTFLKNTSEQFEARVVNVKVEESPSIFFKGMDGSVLPIPVAHGEGRAAFKTDDTQQKSIEDNLVSLRYVDADNQPTELYPTNPNGSPQGITALTTPDGRATILMPHPERAFQSRQLSWHPADWPPNSPWLKLFQNAREWVENKEDTS